MTGARRQASEASGEHWTILAVVDDDDGDGDDEDDDDEEFLVLRRDEVAAAAAAVVVVTVTAMTRRGERIGVVIIRQQAGIIVISFVALGCDIDSRDIDVANISLSSFTLYINKKMKTNVSNKTALVFIILFFPDKRNYWPEISMVFFSISSHKRERLCSLFLFFLHVFFSVLRVLIHFSLEKTHLPCLSLSPLSALAHGGRDKWRRRR